MSSYPDFSHFNYQVIDELGRNREGGRISYLANCSNSSQQVVIKQFRFLQAGASWQGFKAYEREIAILQELNHPRIPQYLNSFETEDGFCMVQEYKDAPSLTTASDLYSLGATAIALLTNTTSVKISNLIDEKYQFNFSHLVTGINPDFIDWLQKMVAPNLKDRYLDAAVAMQELVSIDIRGEAKSKPQSKKLTGLIIVSSLITLLGVFIYPNFKPANNSPSATISQPQQSNLSLEKQWFNQIKPNCNSLEVVTAMANKTYLQTPKGIGYAASCYALAGRIDLAEKVIEELPPNLRVYAAEVVFNIGHPVADSGDDKSAGKIMDLVLKYWSENYMALYHAGMSAYVLGEYSKAENHLEEFIRIYQRNDGWTNKAKLALSRIEQNIPADRSFSIHH